eukprot:m.245351 g.245351  ORF g.245351 m.245351 type:complete len:56 (-) comp15365_c1_seq11:399-566(-)
MSVVLSVGDVLLLPMRSFSVGSGGYMVCSTNSCSVCFISIFCCSLPQKLLESPGP